AHGFDRITCEGDTGSEPIERGWWSNIILAGAARRVPFEGKQQVERFAAFQHPNRSALAFFV
ncbi:MAG: hypothetical protein VX382_01405, partial [Candidatus Thermoplasmatota archaeon]|nr:hypothetical protein [Candidatus Thermoplasmatota archaeon]